MFALSLTLAASLLASAAPRPRSATAAAAPLTASRQSPPGRLGQALPIDDAWLAGDSFGRILRLREASQDWEVLGEGLPALPPLPTKLPLLAADRACTEVVYALRFEPVHSRRTRARLYRSGDGGSSWIAIREVPGGEAAGSLRVQREDGGHRIELVADDRVVTLHDRVPLSTRAAPATERTGPRHRELSSPSVFPEPDFDDGDIAVLHDEGYFVNANDLAGNTLRFEPTGLGGYRLSFSASSGPIVPVGTALGITDEQLPRVRRTLPFAFPFYESESISDIYISDNGGLFLGTDSPLPDPEEHDLFGSRIAPLWDDFDPGAGGSILYDASPGAVTVTWVDLPQFDPFSPTPDRNTFQVVLEASGAITFQWDAGLAVRDGLTGISSQFLFGSVSGDLSIFAGVLGPFWIVSGEAVYEQFTAEVNAAAVAQRFLACHEDRYDQVLVFGASSYPGSVTGETLGFSELVRNDVDGIGVGRFDDSQDYGSSGVLRQVSALARLGDLPDDPLAEIGSPGFDLSPVELIAAETAHIWGAYVAFDSNPSDPCDFATDASLALLALPDNFGRPRDWSFFHDTGASLLGGNSFSDLGGGRFRSGEALDVYSPLDRYLMGIVPAAGVPSFAYIDPITDPGCCTAARGASPCGAGLAPCESASRPERPVDVEGSRVSVNLADVIACEGPRSAGAEPTPLRQAWVLIVPKGVSVSAGDPDILKLQSYQGAFRTLFAAAAAPGSIDTTLVAASSLPTIPVGNALDVWRSGSDVVMLWWNSTTDSPRFNVHGTGDKTLLEDTPAGIGATPLLESTDLPLYSDLRAVTDRPSPFFYEVHSRDCQDQTVFP